MSGTILPTARRRTLLIVTTIALTAVTITGTALAEDGWWPARLVGPNGHGADVASAPAGSAHAVWATAAGEILTASRSSGGNWSTPATLGQGSSETEQVELEINDHGAAVATWTRRASGRGEVHLATRDAGGGWSAPTIITDDGVGAFQPAVAINDDGEAAAVWRAKVDGIVRVFAAQRAADGDWSAATPISDSASHADEPKVALTGDGSVVAVWAQVSRPRRLWSAHRPAGGSWTSPSDVSAADGVEFPVVAAGDDGMVLAVWGVYADGWRLRSASMTPGGTWLSPVDVPGSESGYAPRLAMNDAGQAATAWYADSGTVDTFAVRVASWTSGGWSDAVTLADEVYRSPDPDVALNSSGEAAAVWHARVDGSTVTYSARRPQGGGWGAVSTLGRSEPLPDDRARRVTIDENGDAVAVWGGSRAPDGYGVYVASSESVSPVTVMTQPGATRQTSRTFPVAWTVSDNWGAELATKDVRYRAAPWNGSYGTLTMWRSQVTSDAAIVYGVAGRTYCFSARARDAGGNLGDWSAERCTSTPVDDRSFTASTSWVRGANSGYYLGTYSTSKTYGGTLSLAGVRAGHLSLLATTCAGCGTVRVSLDGTTLATVNLSSATTVRRKLFSIATFDSVREGTVRVRVVSSTGKPVYVDGLVVKR